jgi:hypothetical protein
MDTLFPSARPHTHVPAHLRADIIASHARPMCRLTTSDAWFRAKLCQRLEDGTSAAITPDRAARLADYSDAWPPHLQAPDNRLSEVERGRLRAGPAIRAAIDRATKGATP